VQRRSLERSRNDYPLSKNRYPQYGLYRGGALKPVRFAVKVD